MVVQSLVLWSWGSWRMESKVRVPSLSHLTWMTATALLRLGVSAGWGNTRDPKSLKLLHNPTVKPTKKTQKTTAS